MKTTTLLSSAILGFFLQTLSGQTAEKTTHPTLVFRFHGGALTSYVDDRLKLFSDGRMELETLSPFPSNANAQNRIGRFQGNIELAAYQTVRAEALKVFNAKSVQRSLPSDSIIVELSFQNDEKANGEVWSLGGFPAAQPIEKLFYQLKAKAETTPIAAVDLNCESKPKRLTCKLKNIGTKPTKIVDPMAVSHSIFCITGQGLKTPLNPLEENDPRKMRPQSIELKSGGIFSFDIPVDSPCDGRVVVKTTDMLINRAYTGHLLGELISNSLLQ